MSVVEEFVVFLIGCVGSEGWEGIVESCDDIKDCFKE